MMHLRLVPQYLLALALAVSAVHADQPVAMKSKAPELVSGKWINTPDGERIKTFQPPR